MEVRRAAKLFALVIAGMLASCGKSAPPVASTSPVIHVSAPAPSPAPTHRRDHDVVSSAKLAAHDHGSCNPSLWRHIYHAYRLQVMAACKTITGVVADVQYESDGDVHILVRLPARRAGLLNATNLSSTDGDLVTEAICVGTVTQSDAVSACAGYTNQVTIPSAGERVRITGTYVLDANHGWMEIHPISSLVVLATAAPPPVAAPPPAAGASCSASATYNSSYGDYDVYVQSNQPDKTVTASDGGYSHSWHTDGSGSADVYLRGPAPGTLITVTVGGAICTTAA